MNWRHCTNSLHRGIKVIFDEGVHLLYHAGFFNYVLMMTVICFPDDGIAVFREVNRVLRPGEGSSSGSLKKAGKYFGCITMRQQKGDSCGWLNSGQLKRWTCFSGTRDFFKVSGIKNTRGFCSMNGFKKLNEME